jgi:SAM-dependent methyltransferase
MNEPKVVEAGERPAVIERPENCRICCSDRLRPSLRFQDYRLVECADCKTIFNETYFLSEEFRNGLFEKDYYDAVQSQAFKDRLHNYRQDPSVKVYDHYLSLLEKQFTEAPGDVLDVGSAFGTFLKVANNRGWRPFGVEYSAYSSAAARDHWGFEIFNGDITTSPYHDGQFDLITYWDVIEHVIDPRANLKKAHSLLKTGGKLIATTDNYQSMLSYIAYVAYKLSFGKLNYPARKFFIPHNTYYFTPANFRLLLRSTGFKPIFFEKLDYPIDKLDVNGLEKRLVSILYSLGDIINMNTQFMFIAEKEKDNI